MTQVRQSSPPAAAAGWQVGRLKHLARLQYGNALPTDVRDDAGDVPVYGSNGHVGVHSSPNTLAPVIVVGRKGSHGKVQYSSAPVFVIDTAYFVDRRSAACDLRWLHYVLGTLELDETSQDTGVPGLSREVAHERKIVVPPLDAQRRIAAFLDYETARIDDLIRLQRRLAATAEEQWQSRLWRAFDAAACPDDEAALEASSRTTSSGSACEGYLRYFIEVLDCKHITPDFVEDGYPLASIREVQGFGVDLSSAKRTTYEYYAMLTEGGRKPRVGDLIYSRNASVGEAAIVLEDKDFAMGQDVCLLRSRGPGLLPEYLWFQLRSPQMRAQLESQMIGATFKRINVDSVKSFRIVVPPNAVQRECVEDLRQRHEEHVALVEELGRCERLLIERRSALVDAAVTGQIDVSAWTPPDDWLTPEVA